MSLLFPSRNWRAYWLTQGYARRNLGLRESYARYWGAKTHFEEKAAVYEIMLKGGVEGYPTVGLIRSWIARKLRWLAMLVDGFE